LAAPAHCAGFIADFQRSAVEIGAEPENIALCATVVVDTCQWAPGFVWVVNVGATLAVGLALLQQARALP